MNDNSVPPLAFPAAPRQITMRGYWYYIHAEQTKREHIYTHSETHHRHHICIWLGCLHNRAKQQHTQQSWCRLEAARRAVSVQRAFRRSQQQQDQFSASFGLARHGFTRRARWCVATPVYSNPNRIKTRSIGNKFKFCPNVDLWQICLCMWIKGIFKSVLFLEAK